jgi:KHA, dimerisation domain of potassium ion channel
VLFFFPPYASPATEASGPAELPGCAARIVLQCDVTAKLVLLPHTWEKLCELGAEQLRAAYPQQARRFQRSSVLLCTADGAAVESLAVVRDGDRLVVRSSIHSRAVSREKSELLGATREQRQQHAGTDVDQACASRCNSGTSNPSDQDDEEDTHSGGAIKGRAGSSVEAVGEGFTGSAVMVLSEEQRDRHARATEHAHQVFLQRRDRPSSFTQEEYNTLTTSNCSYWLQVRVCVCVCVCVCVDVVWVCVCVCVCLLACVYVWGCLFGRVCLFLVCMCVCVYVVLMAVLLCVVHVTAW